MYARGKAKFDAPVHVKATWACGARATDQVVWSVARLQAFSCGFSSGTGHPPVRLVVRDACWLKWYFELLLGIALTEARRRIQYVSTGGHYCYFPPQFSSILSLLDWIKIQKIGSGAARQLVSLQWGGEQDGVLHTGFVDADLQRRTGGTNRGEGGARPPARRKKAAGTSWVRAAAERLRPKQRRGCCRNGGAVQEHDVRLKHWIHRLLLLQRWCTSSSPRQEPPEDGEAAAHAHLQNRFGIHFSI
jgi:hypothetical protein